MTEAAPPLALLPAALDFGNVPELVLIGLRLLFACVAGALGWACTGPVFQLLYRLAFQRPAPAAAVTLARGAGAALVALLVFFYLHFGLGGGGGGSGGGTGPGKGPGKNGTAADKAEGKDKKAGDGPTRPAHVLSVELIPSAAYEKDDRWYLVEGKGARLTLADVRKHLEAEGDRVREVEVVLFSDAPVEESPLVQDLVRLTAKLGLKHSFKTYPYPRNAPPK